MSITTWAIVIPVMFIAGGVAWSALDRHTQRRAWKQADIEARRLLGPRP